MGGMVTLAAVVGGRPNLMKTAPVLRAIEQYNRAYPAPRLGVKLVHTGLPNDPRLTDTSWMDVQMPTPDVHLGVGNAAAAEQIARVMMALERYLASEPVQGVVVVGDSDASAAGALVAAKRGLPVFHIEAGLRSRDMTMPEEVNRVVVDAVARLLFTPSLDASANLTAAGRHAGDIVCVGNVMVDNLYHHLTRCKSSDVLLRLGLLTPMAAAGMPAAVVPVAAVPRYVVVTLQRPENTERREVMAGLLQTANGVARTAPVIFPVSHGLRKRLEDWGLDDYYTDLTARLESYGGESPALPSGLYIVPPIPYLDFLRLLSESTVVVTDSGGIQEETTAMGIPCLTVRDETERPITVTEGTNRLVGHDRERLRVETLAALSGHGKRGKVPVLWDGHAAERIAKALGEYYLKRAA